MALLSTRPAPFLDENTSLQGNLTPSDEPQPGTSKSNDDLRQTASSPPERPTGTKNILSSTTAGEDQYRQPGPDSSPHLDQDAAAQHAGLLAEAPQPAAPSVFGEDSVQKELTAPHGIMQSAATDSNGEQLLVMQSEPPTVPLPRIESRREKIARLRSSKSQAAIAVELMDHGLD